MHFAVEFNFAGMPAGADDRYFHAGIDAQRPRLGRLGSQLDLADADALGLTDEWLGIDVGLEFSRRRTSGPSRSKPSANRKAASNWSTNRSASPRTGTCKADADGRWIMTILLSLDTRLAESRIEKPVVAVHT